MGAKKKAILGHQNTMFVITLFHNLPYILGTELGLRVRESGFIVSYMLWFRLSSLLLSRQKFSFIYLFILLCV